MNVSHENLTASVPAIWHYSAGIFSLLCLLGGLFSNGLVIFIFISNSNLRQPKNFLVINLAITDLGLLLANSTLHIIASFNKYWPFGQIGCNLYALCGGICALASIATMVAISLTRLMAVINPFSSLRLSGNFILKCIAFSWIYGSIWIVLPLFGWGRFVFEGFGTTCTFDYISKDIWNRSFICLLVLGGFLIPLFIILISYTIILIKLSERGRYLMYPKIDNQNHQLETRSSSVYYYLTRNSSQSESNETNKITQNLRRIEVRAARTALLVITIFCIAWGPYALMVVLSQLGFNYFINIYSTAILGLLTKTAACINPLIYALSATTFNEQICCCVNLFYRERNHRLSSMKWFAN